MMEYLLEKLCNIPLGEIQRLGGSVTRSTEAFLEAYGEKTLHVIFFLEFDIRLYVI